MDGNAMEYSRFIATFTTMYLSKQFLIRTSTNQAIVEYDAFYDIAPGVEIRWKVIGKCK